MYIHYMHGPQSASVSWLWKPLESHDYRILTEVSVTVHLGKAPDRWTHPVIILKVLLQGFLRIPPTESKHRRLKLTHDQYHSEVYLRYMILYLS